MTLAEPDRSDETVAHAATAHRVLKVAPLADVGRGRLGRAAVADLAVLAAVGDPQIARLACPPALLVHLGVGDSPRQIGNFERKARGRGQRVGAHAQTARKCTVDEGPPQLGVEARLLAQREGGADLDAGRPDLAGLGELSRAAVGAGEPEWKSELAQLLKIDHVPRAVNGLSLLVEGHRPPRRSVVATRHRAFDYEAVRARATVPGEIRREHVRGDDRQELRAA